MKSNILLSLLVIAIVSLLVARYGLVDELVSMIILGKVPYTSIVLSWQAIALCIGAGLLFSIPATSRAYSAHLSQVAPKLVQVQAERAAAKTAGTLPRRRYSYLQQSNITSWSDRFGPKAQLLQKKLLTFGRGLTNRLQRMSIFRKTSA